jgi:hypothetical protein
MHVDTIDTGTKFGTIHREESEAGQRMHREREKSFMVLNFIY